ncbi:YafY family protein [Streptomyces sp. NPDC048420]|uniref:helix-turn-helix transcriptional regulator n=1 Tax=Streptomyces sp. NPDC048420 TaxID=3155755 RepID=UPI0034397BE3
MKADRLVATLLLLQARGQVTAREVARELEVSERTARRDLEALGTAGVPVYSQRGRGGGWQLVGGARTDLTGLTAGETEALFLATALPSPSPELRSALRKLMRALPAPMRSRAEAATRSVMADPQDWSRTEEGAGGEHRRALERAVLDGEQVVLGYAPPGRTPTERTVHPLGLVSKSGRWYLVATQDAGGRPRTFRLGRILSVTPVGEPAHRPDGFELTSTWGELTRRMDERMSSATVYGRADNDVLPLLSQLFGGRLRVTDTQPDGRVGFTVDGPSTQALTARLAGLGERVEVLGPPEARESLARLGKTLVAAYGGYQTGSHFPLGTYYSADANVQNVPARSTVRPVRRGSSAAATSPNPHSSGSSS